MKWIPRILQRVRAEGTGENVLITDVRTRPRGDFAQVEYELHGRRVTKSIGLSSTIEGFAFALAVKGREAERDILLQLEHERLGEDVY